MCPYEDAISERLALGPAWTPWSASDSPEDRAYRDEQDDHIPGDDRPTWSSDDDEQGDDYQ